MNGKDRQLTQKELVIRKLQNVLRGQAMFVRESTIMTMPEKLEQMDVILDMQNFLNHYDEYSKVLEKYKIQQEMEISDR